VAAEFPWLQEIYRLVATDEKDAAVDILYERVDELHRRGEFAASDRVIAQVDLERLDTLLLVALLSITCPASHELQNRAKLVERIEARLMELAPDRIEGLMEGLR
jgi:hypothetical protein